MKQKGFAPILILVLIAIGIAGYFGYKYFKSNYQIAPAISPTPTASQTPNDDLTNWKTYTDSAANYTFRYPDFYTPTQKFLPLKSGESVLIATSAFNFDSGKLSLCKTYQEPSCLIPGKNWYQEKDVLPTTLSGKRAVSFFISIKNKDAGSDVIHVIQTTEKPFVEIALTVGGQGGEETFQQILSTFKFLGQTNDLSSSYSVQIPSSWNGKYKIVTSQRDSCDEYDFISTSSNHPLFSICRMTTVEWSANQNLNSALKVPIESKLGTSAGYVYYKNLSLENPYSGNEATTYQNLSADIPAIIKTFKLIIQ